MKTARSTRIPMAVWGFGFQLLSALLTPLPARPPEQGAVQTTKGTPTAVRPLELIQIFQQHTQSITCLAFAPDGKTVASGSLEHAVRVWEYPSGRQLAVLSGHQDAVRSLAFSPDGRWIASGSMDCTVRVWDVASGKERCLLAGHRDSVDSLSFHPLGERFASGDSGGMVKIWDCNGGRLVGQIRPSPGGLRCLAYSPEGKLLVTGATSWLFKPGIFQPATVMLFDEDSLSPAGDFGTFHEGVNAMAFDPLGHRLAVSGGSAVEFWSLKHRTKIRVFRGQDYDVWSLAFSPDGRLLAAGSEDGKMILWDTKTGKSLASWNGHQGAVTTLAFSPDGSALASAGWDKSIRLWEVKNATRHDEKVKPASAGFEARPPAPAQIKVKNSH